MKSEGKNFTPYSVIYVDGNAKETTFLSEYAVTCAADGIEKGDRVTVRQVAEGNGLSVQSAELDVVIRLVTIMLGGAVEGWLRGELPQTPEELTERIDVMFQDYIRGASLRLKQGSAT